VVVALDVVSGRRVAAPRGMENLFRLMLVRPAVSHDPEQPSILPAQDSDYQNAVREAVDTGGGVLASRRPLLLTPRLQTRRRRRSHADRRPARRA
jgi:hypothetical protein